MDPYLIALASVATYYVGIALLIRRFGAIKVLGCVLFVMIVLFAGLSLVY